MKLGQRTLRMCSCLATSAASLACSSCSRLARSSILSEVRGVWGRSRQLVVEPSSRRSRTYLVAISSVLDGSEESV